MTKTGKVLLALALFCAALVAGGAALGPGLAPRAAVGAAAGFIRGENIPAGVQAILSYRLTRLAAALVVGAALAAAGTSLQALLRNPLADPYILGIAAGGGFGAAVAATLGWGGGASFSGVNAMAFAGALVAVGAGYIVARGAGILSVHALLLAGVMVGAFFTSLILLVMAVVPVRDQHAVFLWLLGDLGSPDLTPAKVLFAGGVVALCVGGLFACNRALDVIVLGDEGAFHLGLNVERFKVGIMVLTSLATAAVVALVGPIGFVGIVVPHALRRIIGPRHGPLLVGAVLGGAALVTLGDTLVRAGADYLQMPIVPVGVFTALIGAPYYLALLRKGKP